MGDGTELRVGSGETFTCGPGGSESELQKRMTYWSDARSAIRY
jgi:hypothetical protein